MRTQEKQVHSMGAKPIMNLRKWLMITGIYNNHEIRDYISKDLPGR